MADQEERTYAVVVRRVPGEPLGVGRLRGVNGEAVFPVYSSAAAAEAHALIMGPEHSVAEGGKEDLAELIATFAPDAEFVAVDPPLAMSDGAPEPVWAVRVEEFLERLRGQE